MCVPCGLSTRSCGVRYLLQCLTFEKAEGGFQSHRTNFKLRQRFVFLQALSALNEGTLLADAEEIFFSIENWISGIKLVNVNKEQVITGLKSDMQTPGDGVLLVALLPVLLLCERSPREE